MTRCVAIDGLPVFDARQPVTLKVTKQDINRASPKEPDHCAVAVACQRQMHAKEVRVHLSRVYVRTNNNNWLRYATPPVLRAEIIAFDRGGRFEPNEFRLVPVSPTKMLTGKRQGSSKKQVASGKKRRPYHLLKDVRTGPA